MCIAVCVCVYFMPAAMQGLSLQRETRLRDLHNFWPTTFAKGQNINVFEMSQCQKQQQQQPLWQQPWQMWQPLRMRYGTKYFYFYFYFNLNFWTYLRRLRKVENFFMFIHSSRHAQELKATKTITTATIRTAASIGYKWPNNRT